MDTVSYQSDSLQILLDTIEKSCSANVDIINCIIPLLVAFIAASVTLYQFKMTIISKARLKWISNFRIITSEFCSKYDSVSLILRNIKSKQEKATEDENIDIYVDEKYKEYEKQWPELDVLYTKIRLYLNSADKREKESKVQNELLNTMNVLFELIKFENLDKLTKENSDNEIDKLIDISQQLIVIQWDKTKRFFR